jgi:hypothetical protein
MDTGIVGLMDPAHGPFVHQSWYWRSRRSIREKQKTFEPIPQGFRMSSHTPSSNSGPYKLLRIYGEEITTQIDFVLPNMRTEQIRCGDLLEEDRKNRRDDGRGHPRHRARQEEYHHHLGERDLALRATKESRAVQAVRLPQRASGLRRWNHDDVG